MVVASAINGGGLGSRVVWMCEWGAGQKSDYGDAALEGRRQRLRREEEALRAARRGDRAHRGSGGRLETGASGETKSESQRV